jgi:hypothetical protein
MSPREKHIPDDAHRTSVCLTAEDRAAIHWIREARRSERSKRTTTNDILVDALWHYLKQTHGMTREQVQSMLPPVPPSGAAATNNVTQMPKPRKKH